MDYVNGLNLDQSEALDGRFGPLGALISSNFLYVHGCHDDFNIVEGGL